MLRTNPEKKVRSATATAFTSLPRSISPFPGGQEKEEKEELEGVCTSLEKMTAPLRGVGPATASLFLSVYSPEVPFYSDDVYLWLCVGVYPSSSPSSSGNDHVEKGDDKGRKKGKGQGQGAASKEVRENGELSVKYDLSEYRRLWGAVRGLRERLNREIGEDEEKISCADVEKVALVVRHIGMSGMEETEHQGEKRRKLQ